MDCEWTFNIVTRQAGRVATIQIAVDNVVRIFHLPFCSERPATVALRGILNPTLVHFLLREDITLVGRQLGGDVAKISRDYGVKLGGKVIELGKLAKRRRAVSDGRSSLQKLSAAVLNRHLEKDADCVRISNWDARLREDQIKYATLDVYASFAVYSKLMRSRNGDPVLDSNLCVGLVVGIVNRSSNMLLGQGEVIKVIKAESKSRNKSMFNAKVRITKILIPGLKVKLAGKTPRNTLGKLQHEFPDGVVFSLDSLQIADSELAEVPLISPTSSTDQSIEELCDNQTRHYTRVKLDSYHWMNRVTAQLDREHSCHLDFCWSLRDAVFILDEGDKRRFSEQLTDTTFDELYAENPDYVLRYVRRTIPQPQVLARRIMDVVDSKTDENTSAPLLNSSFDTVLRNAMVHVKRGCLSDPPGMELYIQLPSKGGREQGFCCFRGTTTNEGTIHQKIVPAFGAQNAGPRLTYSMLLDFAAHSNMKAAVRNRGDFDHGHFDPWLLDLLSSLRDKVLGQPLEDWIPSCDLAGLQSFPFLLTPIYKSVDFEPYCADTASKMEPGLAFIALKTNVKFPVLPVHGKEEMTLFKQLQKSNSMEVLVKRWNSEADGKNIFYKTSALLLRHEKVRKSALNRTNTRLNQKQTVACFLMLRVWLWHTQHRHLLTDHCHLRQPLFVSSCLCQP